MRAKSLLLCGSGAVAASGLLLGALIFTGPILSGAFFFSSGTHRKPAPHPLPADYRPLHKGHIDLSTGLYVREDEDLVLPGTPSFILRRTYRTEDRQSRAFGIGASDPGEWYLYGDGVAFQWAELIKEDGSRVHFDRVTRGHGFSNAVYQTWSPDPEFYGARLGWTGFDWVLRLWDGSFGRFRGCGPAGTSCTITMWHDADGHETRFVRDAAGLLRRIEAGPGWIALEYDASRRVSQARDSAGHTMHYAYDDAGRLRQAKSSDGTTRLYDYDAQDRLTRITDPTRTVENEYDARGLCVRQRVTAGQSDPDPYLYHAAYVLEDNRVVHVDVEESGEPPVRYRFTSSRSLEAEIYNPDTGRPTTVTYDRDPRTHFVSGVTVTCAGNGRWRVSHSLPTTPDERDDTKARLLAQWCAPQM